jgi:hypothetical protein
MRHILLFAAIFWLSAVANAQLNGWSTPIPIDSAKGIGDPLMAVSSKGQIAVLGGGSRLASCPLYISDDNGKSFQLRYQFMPPTSFYEIWYPNGIAYDSNNVLWVYWAWDECSDNDCTFSLGRWLYLSRSTDSGKTFEHVLQMKRGFQMGIRADHEQWMLIGKDNTIHLLRDTAWYNSEKMFTDFTLIYTKLQQGDWTKQQDFRLPLIPDSIELSGGISFCVPIDDKPIIGFSTEGRSNVQSNYLFTKLSIDQLFFPYSTPDSTGGSYKFINTNSGQLYLNYFGYNPDSNAYSYLTRISSDYGNTFGKPLQISQEAFYIVKTNANKFYSFKWFNPLWKMMLYTFDEIISPPQDSVHLGTYVFAYLTFDKIGGIYIVVVDTQNTSYFIGKDIITSVVRDVESYKVDSGVQLSVSPNPFNNSTIFLFTLPNTGIVNITIYDILGRKVQEIPKHQAVQGENKISLDANTLTSGTYIIALHYNNNIYTSKAVIIK